MRKFITPLIIGLAVTGSAYALIANLFPDTLDFPRVPTWDGTIGGTISLILGGVDIASYVGDGTVENTQKLGGFTGTGYLKNRECLNTDVWLSIGSSGIPNCGLTGSLLSMNIGTLTGVVGSIVITKPDSSTMAGVDGVELYAGDILSTAGASSGTLAFSDASVIRLDELTTVELTGSINGSGYTIAQIILSDGNLWGRVLTSTGIEIGGGGYIAGIRGTSISVERNGTGFIFAIVDSIISDTGAVNIKTNSGTPVTQLGSGMIFAYTGGTNHIYHPGKITLLSGSIWRRSNTINDMEYLFKAQFSPLDTISGSLTTDEVISITTKTQQELLATIPLQNDVSMCEVAGVSGCNDIIIGDLPDELKALTGALTPEQIKSQREVQAKTIICESKYGGVFWSTIGGCVISPPGETIIWMADYTNLQDQSLVKQPPMSPTMVLLRDTGSGIPPIRGKNLRIPSQYEVLSGTTLADDGNVMNNTLWNGGKSSLYASISTMSGLISIEPRAGSIRTLLTSATNSGFTEIHVPRIQSGSMVALGDITTWGTWRYPGGVWFRMSPNDLIPGSNGIELNSSGQYIAYPLSEIGGTGALLGKTIEIELYNNIPGTFASGKGYILDVGPLEKYYILKKDFKCDGATPDIGKQYICKFTGASSPVAELLPGQRTLTITGITNPTQLVIGNYWKPSSSATHLKAPIMNTIKSIKILAPQSCSDGIKNNGETYTDCGGPHCGACGGTASCIKPWGGTMGHGTSIIAYYTASPNCGINCNSEVRTCNNGILSGTFTERTCTAITCHWSRTIDNTTTINVCCRKGDGASPSAYGILTEGMVCGPSGYEGETLYCAHDYNGDADDCPGIGTDGTPHGGRDWQPTYKYMCIRDN